MLTTYMGGNFERIYTLTVLRGLIACYKAQILWNTMILITQERFLRHKVPLPIFAAIFEKKTQQPYFNRLTVIDA